MSSSVENLHVPQSKSGSALNSQTVKSIMDAYKTQSKIRLYDDDSAQTQGAGNENIGVTGRNIPLSMLRPSATPVDEIDENIGGGARTVRKASSGSRMLQDVKAYGDIARAYREMNGINDDEDAESEYEGEKDIEGYDENGTSERVVQRHPRRRDLSSVKRFEAGYIEDIPDSDEGLLEVLELAINNARSNLEMLESLYAALSPSSMREQEQTEYLQDLY